MVRRAVSSQRRSTGYGTLYIISQAIQEGSFSGKHEQIFHRYTHIAKYNLQIEIQIM